jgi:antitoxin ParD1/3/4
MAGTEKRTFDLAAEQAAFIDAQVASGAFTSANEVVSEGLRELQQRDAQIESWLRDEVVPTYDEMEAHPERAVSGEQWFESILKLRGAYSKSGA